MAPKLRKTLNISVVATMTFLFGATPAFAHNDADRSSPKPAMASLSAQGLATVTTAVAPATNIDLLMDLASIESGPTARFDVEATIAAAEAEIGTSRPTGWSQPGECIASAQRWILAGGGAWVGSGNPVDNYAGATRLPFNLVQAGDIVQYENLYAPYAWVTGVHTVLVTKVHEDGSVDIIQSNSPAGSGLVSKDTNWLPAPPAGFQAVVWRF